MQCPPPLLCLETRPRAQIQALPRAGCVTLASSYTSRSQFRTEKGMKHWHSGREATMWS